MPQRQKGKLNGNIQRNIRKRVRAAAYGRVLQEQPQVLQGGGRDSEYFKPVMSMLDERGIEQRIYDRFGGEALVKCGVART